MTAMKTKSVIPRSSQLYLVQFISDTATTHIISIRCICFTTVILDKYRTNTIAVYNTGLNGRRCKNSCLSPRGKKLYMVHSLIASCSCWMELASLSRGWFRIYDTLEDEKKGLSQRLHGYRPSRSTNNAINKVNARVSIKVCSHAVLIALDIRNAFNSANCQLTLKLMHT